MNYTIHEWLNLALRWFHVFAGILWIGQTYFFTWLDRRFHDEQQVWMVHSGGFYEVNKKNAPDLTRQLHWFRWEAALTWLSGVFLLILVYYMGGLVPEKNGIIYGLVSIPLGVIVYEILWSSPIGKNQILGAAISLVLITSVAYGLTRVMSPRAAYMHVGAILGTIMAANVWERILPAQRQMIAAARDGGIPDAALAAKAKLRSKHNTFIVMPVVFIMLSNHFPVATYGQQYNWLILGGLTLAGWIAAKVVREH